MTAPTRFTEIAAPFLEATAAKVSLGLKFVDDRIDVHSNSEELIEILRTYYREFLCDDGPAMATITAVQATEQDLGVEYTVKTPEPGKKSLKEEYADFPDGRVVRKIKTGMSFMFGGDVRLAVGPCLDNDPQVVNFINNTYIEAIIKRGALLFHAAGIARGGKGLCMAGFSGAGKSTLALEIMRKGTDFVSNDRIMASRTENGLFMTGVPKMPRVNPGTVLHNENLWPVMTEEERLKFQALPQEELWDLEYKYDAFIDTCFGPGKFTLQSEMSGLVLLNWQRDDAPLRHSLVKLGERRELMPSFMKSVGLFFEADDPAEQMDADQEQYLALLDNCPVLEFTGGIDFAKAADTCLEFLEKI